MERLLQQFHRLAGFQQDGFDVFLQPRPAREPIFARQDELRLVQAEFPGTGVVAVRVKSTDAFHGGGFAGEELFTEVFGLIPELFQTGPRRQ